MTTTEATAVVVEFPRARENRPDPHEPPESRRWLIVAFTALGALLALMLITAETATRTRSPHTSSTATRARTARGSASTTGRSCGR
jgi:hypothetical protein